MKLLNPGKNISVEVLEISKHGIWISLRGKEYFLPYEHYPWFKEARISEIYNICLIRDARLHWPDLDVDLEIESILHPEKYPLIYR